MMGNWHDAGSGDWGWMVAMMGFGLAVLAVAVWAVVSPSRRDRTSRVGGPTALEELDRRLARGEISPDEHKRRRDAMHPAGS